MNGAILTAEGLTLSIDGVELLHNVHFSVPAGKITCLVGESGSGKSLTMAALLGLLPEGAELAPESRVTFRGQGMFSIYQDPINSFNPSIRVGKQLYQMARGNRKVERKAFERGIAEVMGRLRLARPEVLLKKYPFELSGGMLQRLMIACAIYVAPSLILADEPTTALDATIQGQILRLILDQSRERGMAVLLITHDLGVVAEVADVVGVMYAGRLVERAPARELFADPRHPYTRGLMHSAPSRRSMGLSRLPTIPGSVPSLQNMPPGCPFQPRCPEAMPRCTEAMPPSFVRGEHAVACWLAESSAP